MINRKSDHNDSASPESVTMSAMPDVPLDGSTVAVMLGSWASDADDGPGVPDRVHCLAISEGLDAGRKIILDSTGVTIGRAEPADIVLSDAQISRSHCRIEIDEQRVVVTDLGSTNGTFVQGARVTAPVDLPIGAGMRVGTHVFRHEFRSRKAIEAAHAQWQLERTLRQDASQIQIEIDQVKREQEVAKITGSEFFRTLTEDLDALRRD